VLTPILTGRISEHVRISGGAARTAILSNVLAVSPETLRLRAG
jgi:hypothetical protein